MTFKPNYIPKERKVNYKIVVPFIIVAAILTVFLIQTMLPNPNDDQGFQICNLSPKESRKLIQKRHYNSLMEFKDFGYYGESLALYKENYQLDKNDLFDGSTIFLNNLCKNEESALLLDKDLDRKLSIYELDDGFYDVEVLDGLDRYFLYHDGVLDIKFESVSRYGYVKELRLLSNPSLFKDEDGEALHTVGVLFMQVSTKKAADDRVDVVLDPSGLYELWEGYVHPGAIQDSYIESEEMYDLAVGVKKILEDNGLKVDLSRDKDHYKNYYGTNGRLAQAYEKKAKYFISLNFPDSGSKLDYGSTVLYSSHTSNQMATYIMKALNEKTSIQPSRWTGDNNIDGVYPSTPDNGLDRRMEIRESGGRFTGAGVLDERFVSGDTRQGMQSIVIEYGYMSNAQDLETWIKEKDSIIEATAEGILKSLGIR